MPSGASPFLGSPGDAELRDGAWTSSKYDSTEDGSSVCTRGCGMMFIYALFSMAVGGAIIALLTLEETRQFVPVCDTCNRALIVAYFVGALYLLTGLLTIPAALGVNRCFSYIFVLFALLFGLLQIAAAVIAVVVQIGVAKDTFEQGWRSAITTDSDLVCDIEARLACSGFSQGCCYFTTGMDSCYTLTNGTAPAYVALDCIPSCHANNFTRTCEPVIRSDIKVVLIPFTVICVVFGILTITVGVSGILRARMRSRARGF